MPVDYEEYLRDMIYSPKRQWQPTPVFLPGKPHGQRSLAGYGPRGRKESDTTERLTHTNMSPPF